VSEYQATLAERAKRELFFNAVPALQISLVALLPFLPFLLDFEAGEFNLASRWNLFIAAGFVLLALLSRWVFFAFSLAFVPLSVLSIHLVSRFGGENAGWRLNQPDARVETFFESPGSETFEYLGAHVAIEHWAMLTAGIAYLGLLAWTLATRPALSDPAKGTAAILLAAWAGIAARVDAAQQLDRWPQYQLVYAALEANARYDRLAERDAALEMRPLPADSCTARYPKVVIVFGESVASNHMSALGYPRRTTPFVDRSRPDILEALAPANQTRVSLALMLTPAVAEDFDAFYRLPSLVSTLEACGYDTLWISNQGRLGRHDSYTTSIAHEAARATFLNDMSYKEARRDGDLVQELSRLGAFDATRQATFIHLIGSHAAYRNRFPRGFGFPQVSRVVDAYDSSILYTDSVLAELYQGFGADGLLFIYVPDHGEVVSEKVFGHGFSPGFQEEYRVPLMIWNADQAAMQKLRAALGGRRLNLESFDDVVGWLVGSRPTLRVSTRTLVSNLAAGNLVHYENLPAFRGSETQK
jgi:glucan phosphoethanolaminetransferase (alkaline phosphatase superfamily)